MKTYAVSFVLLAIAVGCAQESTTRPDAITHPFSDELTAVVVKPATEIGGSFGSYAPISICQHAAWSNYGAGIFTVREFVGVAEAEGDEILGYTYIVLETNESWFGDLRAEEVVRVSGGPTSETTFTGSNLNLHVGQEVVMMLRGGTAGWNEGFPSSDPMRTYVAASDNGDLWDVYGYSYDTDTLRRSIQAAYESFREGEFSSDYCGVEVDFDRCPEESLAIPPGAVFFDEPCEAERDRPEPDPSLLDDGEPASLDAGIVLE